MQTWQFHWVQTDMIPIVACPKGHGQSRHVGEVGSESRLSGCKSTHVTASLLFSSGCFPILSPGMEGELLTQPYSSPGSQDRYLLNWSWIRIVSLQTILVCCLGDLWLSEPLPAVLNPMGNSGWRRRSPTFRYQVWILDLPVIIVTEKLHYESEWRINHCIDTAVCPWVSYLTSLCLTFFTYKREIINSTSLIRGLQGLSENLFKELRIVVGE